MLALLLNESIVPIVPSSAVRDIIASSICEHVVFLKF